MKPGWYSISTRGTAADLGTWLHATPRVANRTKALRAAELAGGVVGFELVVGCEKVVGAGNSRAGVLAPRCRCGVELDPNILIPHHDPATGETNQPGLYVAGTLRAGRATDRIFIENSREHGEQIIGHLVGRR